MGLRRDVNKGVSWSSVLICFVWILPSLRQSQKGIVLSKESKEGLPNLLSLREYRPSLSHGFRYFVSTFNLG